MNSEYVLTSVASLVASVRSSQSSFRCSVMRVPRGSESARAPRARQRPLLRLHRRMRASRAPGDSRTV